MKWTTHKISRLKGQQRIPVLTAYDYITAQLIDRAGIPIILIGDSLGMTVLGYDSTIPVTLHDMIHHTKAVARGARDALLVADMPFLTYQVSREEAVLNAGRLIQEGGAHAVKIEGGAFRSDTIQHLVANGIPVMGHIGLTPQSVHAMGGYRVQGRTEEAAQILQEDALALEQAGVFALVLEGIPSPVATRITDALAIPTIGIGAGAGCDGQVLVVHDLLGLNEEFTPKFVKRYAHLSPMMTAAFRQYKTDVETGQFPDDTHSY